MIDKSIKVLQLGKFYPVRGGVEKVMYDLMIGLSEQGVSCDMLCASTEDYPAGTTIVNPKAKLIIVPTLFKLSATKIAPFMITKLRNIANSYDIIHVHHPDPMACLALFLSGYKGKVVLHWHSDILKQKMLLKLYSPLQRWLIKRADRIVGTTPVYVHESDFLKYVKHKLDWIPIGIEPVVGDLKQITKIRNRYPNKKIVLSVGRLVEYKGYEYLIKAAKKFGDDVQLLIGGKGPLLASLEKLVHELGLNDRVEFIGFVSDEMLPSYFEACDVFCLSSIWKTEAFAIVQIEAMSCGKPVVSTDIPGSGVSWVNKHMESGLVVPIQDSDAIATSVRSILEDDQLYMTLAHSSRARYFSEFTLAKMATKCISLYSSILN